MTDFVCLQTNCRNSVDKRENIKSISFCYLDVTTKPVGDMGRMRALNDECY